MNNKTVWRYWFITVICLGVAVLLWPPAAYLAIAVTVAHAIHLAYYVPGLTTFQMQIRLGTLILLIIGLSPLFLWVQWAQFIGGIARITVSYCLMARFLMLFPWNRSRPISLSLVSDIVFTRPNTRNVYKLVNPG